MPKLKPDHISPTPEEDAAIRAAIAEDPDTFEAQRPEWFREAKPAQRGPAGIVGAVVRQQPTSLINPLPSSDNDASR